MGYYGDGWWNLHAEVDIYVATGIAFHIKWGRMLWKLHCILYHCLCPSTKQPFITNQKTCGEEIFLHIIVFWQASRWHLRIGQQSQSLHVSVPQLQLHRVLPSRPSHPASGIRPARGCVCAGEWSKLCGRSGGLLCHSLPESWWPSAICTH